MADLKNEIKCKAEEEAKECNHVTRKNEEPIIKEKIVYKVVHVPYYYPVPVDTDYYYQNEERFLRQPEKFNEHFLDHIPPPLPHGYYPRRPRENSHHYVAYPHEYSRHHLRYSRSPSPKFFERRYLSDGSASNSPVSTKEKEKDEQPKQKKESEETEVTKETNDNNNNTKNGNKEKQNEENSIQEKPVNEPEPKENVSELKLNEMERKLFEEDPDSNEDSSMKRKKRYLMTFPYDQRHKDEERKRFKCETSDQSVPDEFIRHENSHYKRGSHYYTSHPSSPHNAPFVMVPMRPVGLHRPDYVHERRCHSDLKDHRDEKFRHEIKHERPDIFKKEVVLEDNNNNEDQPKDVRYHTNGRRVRTVFSRQQLLTLNNVFQKHPFVSGERMSELSSQLGLDRKIVKIWFQNKRQNARKKGSLFERADDYYYDYQERYAHRSTPPTMAESW